MLGRFQFFAGLKPPSFSTHIHPYERTKRSLRSATTVRQAVAAEAHEAAQQLEAVSLEVGLRLRAFAEFERQNMLLEEQGGKKAQPDHTQLRLGSA